MTTDGRSGYVLHGVRTRRRTRTYSREKPTTWRTRRILVHKNACNTSAYVWVPGTGVFAVHSSVSCSRDGNIVMLLTRCARCRRARDATRQNTPRAGRECTYTRAGDRPRRKRERYIETLVLFEGFEVFYRSPSPPTLTFTTPPSSCSSPYAFSDVFELDL